LQHALIEYLDLMSLSFCRHVCRFCLLPNDYATASNINFSETTMKYLCLICAETVMEQMSDDVAAQQFAAYAAFTQAIRDSGHYLGCNRLLRSNTAVTVKVRSGKMTVTDGPFAETKEQLGGYYLIDARDLNEAIQIAARIPGAQHGCVEVRPVAEDEATLRALGFGDN
jgi:hypothetical protein